MWQMRLPDFLLGGFINWGEDEILKKKKKNDELLAGRPTGSFQLGSASPWGIQVAVLT